MSKPDFQHVMFLHFYSSYWYLLFELSGDLIPIIFEWKLKLLFSELNDSFYCVIFENIKSSFKDFNCSYKTGKSVGGTVDFVGKVRSKLVCMGSCISGTSFDPTINAVIYRGDTEECWCGMATTGVDATATNVETCMLEYIGKHETHWPTSSNFPAFFQYPSSESFPKVWSTRWFFMSLNHNPLIFWPVCVT